MQNTHERSHPFEVTRQSVFAIVWPVMLASITVPLMGITDTAVIGQMDDVAILGGLAMGAILLDLIFTGLNFLRSSTTGLTAQALGAKKPREQSAVLIRAILLSVLIGLPLILLSQPMLDAGLDLMKPSADVASAVTSYFLIRILAAPFTLLNYALLGWLFGLGLAKRGLALQIIESGFNIILSIYLGLYQGYGLEGVAWATVIAEVLATLMGFAMAAPIIKPHWPAWVQILDGHELKRTLSLNSNIMVRSFALLFAFSFFTAQGSRLGDVTLAANAVLFNFFLLQAYMLDGFATATEQLVGKAIGARYRPAFDQTIRISLFWSGLISVGLFIFYMLFGPLIIDVLTINAAVREEAYTYLIWAALTGVFGVVAFLMDGVFIGATWSKDMRNMMLLSLAVYLLAWWVLMPIWGNHGLWAALEVFLGMRGITLWLRLKVKRLSEPALA